MGVGRDGEAERFGHEVHEYLALVRSSADDDALVLDRSRFLLEFEEDFGQPSLDPRRWVAHYLPSNWTTPERSEARYDLEPGLLRLRIDADQPAWRPGDGGLRVSSLQTGTGSGSAGSPVRARAFTARTCWCARPSRAGRCTRRPQAWSRRYCAPTLTRRPCSLSSGSWGFLAFRSSPANCVCELFGDRIGSERSAVNIGVKASPRRAPARMSRRCSSS